MDDYEMGYRNDKNGCATTFRVVVFIIVMVMGILGTIIITNIE